MLPARSGFLIVPLTLTSTPAVPSTTLTSGTILRTKARLLSGHCEGELQRSIIGDCAGLDDLPDVKRHPAGQCERMNIRLLYLPVDDQYFVSDPNGKITACRRQTGDAGSSGCPGRLL